MRQTVKCKKAVIDDNDDEGDNDDGGGGDRILVCSSGWHRIYCLAHANVKIIVLPWLSWC